MRPSKSWQTNVSELSFCGVKKTHVLHLRCDTLWKEAVSGQTTSVTSRTGTLEIVCNRGSSLSTHVGTGCRLLRRSFEFAVQTVEDRERQGSKPFRSKRPVSLHKLEGGIAEPNSFGVFRPELGSACVDDQGQDNDSQHTRDPRAP